MWRIFRTIGGIEGRQIFWDDRDMMVSGRLDGRTDGRSEEEIQGV